MLKVNEIFGPTIQGEGKSLGKKVVFLRLALCNLHCVWCDTAYTWRYDAKHPHNDDVVYSPKKEVHLMSEQEVFIRLVAMGVKSLVISGGEPTLQQKQLIPLLQNLKGDGWWIEVETNGTVPLRSEFVSLVDQINCSPKLANSGDPEELRIREKTLQSLVKNKKTNFKFVISTDKDAVEAKTLVTKFGMEEVFFMPEGRTREELTLRQNFVQALAGECGTHYTPRQHIIQWGTKRGV